MGSKSRDLSGRGTLRSWGDEDEQCPSKVGWSGARPGNADFTFDAFASGKSLNSEVSLCVKWVE